jgi:Chaperone of endosialidase
MEGSGGDDGRVTVQGSLYVEGGLSCQRIDKDKKRWWSRIVPKDFDPGDWQYATFTPGTSAPSDIRFKKDLSPITDALAKVKQLNGTHYRWGETGLKHLTQNIETTISAGPDATEEENQKLWAEERQKAYQALAAAKIGLIAQNVETVAPEVVHEDKEGYKYIDYQDLTALLVEAIKEQQGLIERLETRISTFAVSN